MAIQSETIPGTDGREASALLEDQVATFKKDGFVVIADVLRGDELEQVYAAFAAAQERPRRGWEEGKVQGKGVSENGEYYASGSWQGRIYFDIYPLHLLEQNDAAVEMFAHPRLLPFLSATVGEDVQVATIQPRVLPPQEMEEAQAEGGYVDWHRDHHSDEKWRHYGRPLNTKVILYLTDVGIDDGCTAAVPGSHLWEHKPDSSLYKGMGGGKEQQNKVWHQREMPDMVAVEATAGSAFLFDTRLWHTALPNTGDHERWCVINLYCPFYQKQPGPTMESAMALDAAGKLSTPERRQIFGLEPMNGRNIYKLLTQHSGDVEDDRLFKGERPRRSP